MIIQKIQQVEKGDKIYLSVTVLISEDFIDEHQDASTLEKKTILGQKLFDGLADLLSKDDK